MDDATVNLSDRFIIVAIFNNVLLGMSSTFKLGVVGVGGVVRILTISSTFGKKVTVCMSLTDLFLGNYTWIHL